MPEEQDILEVLEAQMEAIANTVSNLQGLVAKTARIQSDLAAARLDAHAEAVGGSFSALSDAAEALEETRHDLEIERNRRRNG